MSEQVGVALCATSTCQQCGRSVEHRRRGLWSVGGMRWHACRMRLISRARWAGHLDGWHSGYRFAVENAADPMVLADAADYGSGWAGLMRNGGVTVAVDSPREAA